MKLSTSLVAVKKITCNAPRSLFADDELEKAAKLILESEGVINPIVVRRTGLKSYEVVDGDFEYYAAARAREIDPKKGEMIGVFIVEEENEELLTQQVKLFRKQKSTSTTKADINSNISSDTLEKFLTNFELRFEKIAHQLLEEATAKVKLEYEVKELKSQRTQQAEPLEVFNNFDASQIVQKLISAGFEAGKAAKIVEAIIKERKKKKFESLNDVVNTAKLKRGKGFVKAITSDKMLDIIDTWSNSTSI
jgi:predicted nucleic acid-binding OB-fold protein